MPADPTPSFSLLLTQLFALLVLARVLGDAFRARGQPAVVGELLAGVLLGPTVVGRCWPSFETALFPAGARQQLMLDTVCWLGTLFLLLIAGMEIDLQVLRRRGKAALLTSLMGIAVPFASGIAVAAAVGDAYAGPHANRETFTLFLGVAMSISAIPVISRILLDLRMMDTTVGQVILAAAVVDDLVGWLVFGMLVASMGRGDSGVPGAGRVALVLGFAVAAVTVGVVAMRRLLAAVQRTATTTGGVLSTCLAVAIGCGAIAETIGVHAVFGAFLAGVMIGGSGELAEPARRSVPDFVLYFFSPIFFAAVGVKVDFAAHLDPRLVAIMLVVAFVGKIGGCGLGALWGGLPGRQALAVGVGMNARGAMEIVLALLALQAGLIRESVFTALILVAIVTSMASGPLLRLLMPETRRPSVTAA